MISLSRGISALAVFLLSIGLFLFVIYAYTTAPAPLSDVQAEIESNLDADYPGIYTDHHSS